MNASSGSGECPRVKMLACLVICVDFFIQYLRTRAASHEEASQSFRPWSLPAARLLNYSTARSAQPGVAHGSRVLASASRDRGFCSRACIVRKVHQIEQSLFRRDAESPSRTGISARDARATRKTKQPRIASGLFETCYACLISKLIGSRPHEASA
jgi:hypothetical protein